jgi:glycosyltransferase involved in cell wall biosynthesis
MGAIEHGSNQLCGQHSNGRSRKPLRILGITPGPIGNLDSTTGYSGIVVSFFGGLAQQHQVTMSSVRPEGIVYYANMLRSRILKRSDWRLYSRKNPWVFQTRSCIAHRAVKRAYGDIDLVVQWQGLNAPFVGRPLKPYAIYTDYVTKLDDAHNYSNYSKDCHRNAKEREIYYRLEGEAYRQAGRVFTWNELVRRSMIESYGVDPEKVINVGVGVCLEPIDPAVQKRYDSRQIVFIGKDSAFIRKGVPNLLAGFALVREVIPDAQLLLVGLNPDRIPPQPGVVNLGFVRDRRRLRDVLEGAALYAMTPLIDPCPGVVREAMAMKLPVVASHVDGIPEMVIDGETGCLVPPEEPGQLAEAIIALLQDENKMRSMGERGYARVLEYFTWERVLNEVEPQLHSLLEERSVGFEAARR